MKQRSTTPVSISFVAKASATAAIVLLAGIGLFQFSSNVFARDYDAEIRAKEQEAQQYNNEAGRLGKVAGTLEEALSEINGQIGTIQGQIASSQRKHSGLLREIDKNKAEIKKNRKTLGLILSDMYVDDQISPLEMLASSNNIGDYIDKQEQRTSLRGSLNNKIKDIRVIQQKLEDNKKAVENVLKDQESQRSQLASKQSEQQKLLDQTKGSQDAYSKLASARNSEIGQLREQQRKSNCEAFGGIWASNGSCTQRSHGGGSPIPPPSSGNGGYPAVWANAMQDSIVDSWGMFNRECVSYVAYRIAASGRNMPYWGGRGNANQWPSNARGAGISTGSTPKAGAAAVMYGGPYGHIMYVEAVNGDMITVSDYNLGVDGLYRNYSRSASGLTYIYF